MLAHTESMTREIIGLFATLKGEGRCRESGSSRSRVSLLYLQLVNGKDRGRVFLEFGVAARTKSRLRAVGGPVIS